MTSNNILSEYGITVPDGKSVAMVIYCNLSGCDCFYIFFSPLGETELRQQEVWRVRADAKHLPRAGRSSAKLLQYCEEHWPQALRLRHSLCISVDAPDVFEANACGYCQSLAAHPGECPSLLGEPSDPEVVAAGRVWYYGYRMGRAGRWSGFIERVHRNSARVRLGYARGKSDLEREGPLLSH
ncbi:MAG TPA: hypothetical protein VLA88_05450 [Candidatus Saccharimonadales bacterium]|nr:hypothetical protein [Candidatus Saccharimonadales bacterium]